MYLAAFLCSLHKKSRSRGVVAALQHASGSTTRPAGAGCVVVAMRLVTELLLPQYHSITSCGACQPPVRNGAPDASCRCSVRSRLPPFPPPAGTRPFTAPAPRAAGPRPDESQRPPRARSRARAGGADDLHQRGPGETAGAAPSPRPAEATLAGGEFRRARRRAGGRGDRPLGGHSMPRLP